MNANTSRELSFSVLVCCYVPSFPRDFPFQSVLRSTVILASCRHFPLAKSDSVKVNGKL